MSKPIYCQTLEQVLVGLPYVVRLVRVKTHLLDGHKISETPTHSDVIGEIEGKVVI